MTLSQNLLSYYVNVGQEIGCFEMDYGVQIKKVVLHNQTYAIWVIEEPAQVAEVLKSYGKLVIPFNEQHDQNQTNHGFDHRIVIRGQQQIKL